MGAASEELLPDEMIAALARGATVITGNQRAARTFRHAFDRRNRSLGLKSWQPPHIMAWDEWTSTWWSRRILEAQTRQMLMNTSQELAVWRAVLQSDQNQASLRMVDGLVGMASDAWRRLSSYNGAGLLREFGVSTDTRAFQRWAQAFQRRCRADGLLAQAGLEEALRESIAAGEATLDEQEVVLVGFDALTPAQSELLDALRTAGMEVIELALTSPVHERLLVDAADETEEMRACARWVRDFIEMHPDATVGVIVPGLEGQRAEIDRVFREVLAPELEDITAGNPGAPYEFSVGIPLASTPMVMVSHDLLRWTLGALPLAKVSALLLSPYFADGRIGLESRAEFDSFGLRREKMLRPELSLDGLTRLIGKSHMLDGVSNALGRMQQVFTRRPLRDGTSSHAEWAEAMRDVLKAAAWGTGETEDSIEFQTRTKWESALDELATLDFGGARVSFSEALTSLEAITQRTIFAPESRDAAVQVLGPLEAAGCRFDAVWFLRAGELSWPIPASTNPLLAWKLQRDLGMPGVDAARDLEFARHVTQRIAESASTVVFSYARHAAEEAGPQRPSPALESLDLEARPAVEVLAEDAVREVLTAEEIEDDVQLPALPDRVIRGGAALLAAQAACGFRAFAEQRLWSSEPETAELGLDAAQRGTVAHRVLELFWENVKTQFELKAMTQEERGETLEWCIGQALQQTQSSAEDPWDFAYVDMERQRLHTLLDKWLDLELKRQPFEVKLSEKKFDDVRVGPLRLRVIVDRVDLVDDGEDVQGYAATQPAEMIIDYKTGNANPSDWSGDRPDAPQLPLYAILSNAERIAGVAFAKVRSGDEMSLHGYTTSKDLLTKSARMKEFGTLAAQIEDWRRVLTHLATDFANGDVKVQPKQYPKTCEYCAQRLVCRLDPAALDSDEDEDGDADSE